MIYCVEHIEDREAFHFIESIRHFDKNEEPWDIMRTGCGFFVQYAGHPYFRETYFNVEIDGVELLLINTGCLSFSGGHFDLFAEIRDLIISSYTDDIWDAFGERLCARFKFDTRLLESENIF